jgi:hypothetical protein
MGNCVDYSYRFGGTDQAKIATALQSIHELQEKHANLNGNGSCGFDGTPQVIDDGSTRWHCYCNEFAENPPRTLRKQLISLTQGGGFHLWFYCECTDGCNESSLELHEDGECTLGRFWGMGTLGLDASIALATVEDHYDANATHTLLKRFLDDCDGKWDEDDFENLLNAYLAATVLAGAFQRWPILLTETFVQTNLAKIRRKLNLLCKGISEFSWFDFEPEKVDALHRLRATVEAEILKQAIPDCPRAKTRATKGVRL